MEIWTSKHRRPPFKGKVRLTRDSSVRKLARALRRDMVPPERMVVIEQAKRSAASRAQAYASKRRMRSGWKPVEPLWGAPVMVYA